MRIRVWDLPVRLFHWALAILVIFSIVTIKVGGSWVEWHMRSGCAILALLLFRIVWGVVGSRTARFASLPISPREIAAYLRGGWRGSAFAGHNPLGSLSVLAMLIVLLFQAASGLFSNDDVDSEGPLAVQVSKRASDLLSALHSWNAVVIYILLGLHVAAIIFYVSFRKQTLIRPMVSGESEIELGDPAPVRDDWKTRCLAFAIFVVCALAVWLLVNTPPPPMVG